jgi:NADP-reducing hydrogenase subunit HndC
MKNEKYKIDKSLCVGCGICIGACPQEAIKIDKDGKAIIDSEKCLDCGACVDSCRFAAIKK